MDSYKLISDGDGWVLQRTVSNETVRSFGGKEEALRESLHIAHRDGSSLILNPDKHHERQRSFRFQSEGLDS